MQKTATIVQILALIALSAFSGALLFVALVMVRFWQAAEPSIFLSWMAQHFVRFPMLMIPLNVIALLMTIAALAASWKSSPDNRLPWGLGLLCLIICTVTFPIYFAGANAEFVTGSVDLTDVPSRLNAWSIWNWARTSLAILAVICAAWGLYQQRQMSSVSETDS